MREVAALLPVEQAQRDHDPAPGFGVGAALGYDELPVQHR